MLTSLSVYANTNTHVIAKTLYAEARSEGPTGILMVATVIYNRGSNYATRAAACLKPKQFSCWNDGLLSTPSTDAVYSPHCAWTDEQAWAFCKTVERKIKKNQFVPMNTWNHYAVNNCKAKWFRKMTNRQTYKNHTFGFLK